MKNQLILFSGVLVYLLIQTFDTPLIAQPYYSLEQPGKNYWQVHTDHQTRNTVVQFFNSRNQLIYTETLPRQYVKLNKKNIRYFDDLLQKFTDNSLLASTVKSYDLVADSRTTFRDNYNFVEPKALNYHHTPQSNVFVVTEGKLKVILKNPMRQYFNLAILDDQLRTIHYESFDIAAYDRSFDMSKLPDGKYKVRITSKNINLFYSVSVDAVHGYRLEHMK